MLQKEIAAKIHASEIRADIDYPKMSSKIWEHVKSEQERAFLAGIDFSNRCAQNNKIMKRTICKNCNPKKAVKTQVNDPFQNGNSGGLPF